jgi:hypothetical protein
VACSFVSRARVQLVVTGAFLFLCCVNDVSVLTA